MKLNLKVVRRKNVSGIKCAAPYINGSNVWDIPEKQWTASVQQAVARAYQLGVKRQIIPTPQFPDAFPTAALPGPAELPISVSV